MIGVRGLRWVLLAATLSLSLPPGLAAAQSADQVEITQINTSRYPRVTMVVELDNAGQVDPAALSVTENGQPVQELEVEPIGESAVEVGIVLAIDTSGSMEGAPLEAVKAAAVSFVTQMRPQDRVAIVSFGSEVQVLAPFTNSRPLLANAIDRLVADSEDGTALYDAVVRSAELYQGDAAKLERNLILLSDGADVFSTATLDDALGAVEEAGLKVFGVGLRSSGLFDPATLQTLVGAGDGLYLETPEPGQLSELYGRIQRELDNRLVVRFTATQQQAGDLTVGVSYAGVSAEQVTAVPGFATTLPASATSLPPPNVITVTSRAVADPGTLVALAVGAAGLAAVLLVIIFAGSKVEAATKAKDRLRAFGRTRSTQPEVKTRLLSRIPLLRRLSDEAEELARKRGLLGAMNAALEQADIPLRPGEAVAGAMGGALVFGVVVGLITMNPIMGAAAFGLGVFLVFAAIQYIGSREKRRFEQQLPDTLTLVSTSLRAGYSMLQAVEAVAEESPNPTSREFARAIAESRLGRPVVAAIEGIAERMQSEDFKWAVMAIEIQREVGGNLAEVLQIVAETMRQRNRLKGEIRALTAEGRISAFVLALLPFGMFLFLWVNNRSYLEPLLVTTAGWVAIGAGILAMAFGIYWMKKIVSIEV